MMEQITQYLVNFLNVIQGLRKTAVTVKTYINSKGKIKDESIVNVEER